MRRRLLLSLALSLVCVSHYAHAQSVSQSVPLLWPVSSSVTYSDSVGFSSSSPISAPIQPLLNTQSAPSGYTPASRLYAQEWHLPLLRLPQAWAAWNAAQKTRKLAPVTVAVLDTGYRPSAGLAGRLQAGYDFVTDPVRSGDGNGRDSDAAGVGRFAYHGEVIASTIAGAHSGSLGDGTAGINPAAKVVAVRVAGQDGLIAPQDLIDGLRWAAGLKVAGVPVNPNPARLINLSLFADFLPLTGCDGRIQAALDEVSAKGVLVIAGAANDSRDAGNYSPAGCRNVLTVTAVNRAGVRASYANYGAAVGLAAYGGEPRDPLILGSAAGVQRLNGTSLATPQVTGVASLLLSLNPSLTPAQLSDILKKTARPFATPCGPDPRKSCGAGILDAAAAVSKVLESR